ncbi:MAG TPA: hypothetical protein DDW45_07670 [Gammaproteobacteria bacterium]|nr:hypothetical protein [Gammaproteobacteria bacterium]
MLTNALDEGLTKHQAVRMYQAAFSSILSGLDEITGGKLDYETEGFFDFLQEHSIRDFIENHWPEFEDVA